MVCIPVICWPSGMVKAGNYDPENGYTPELRNNLCFNAVATVVDPIAA
ncbi:MAG TPA: hypothetical protein VII28_06740 [Puia sp.]